MIAALIVLAVLAVTGWGAVLALLIGRGIRLADQRQARPCARCGGEMWVCEEHPDWPWNSGEGCGNPTDCCRDRPFHGQTATDPCPFIDGCQGGLPCEMPGAPCPDCNSSSGVPC